MTRRKARAPGRMAWRVGAAGLMVVLQVVAVTALATAPARADGNPPVSDEFSGSALDTSLWSVTDPRGDTTVSESGGALSIAVPGGTTHDMWSSGLNGPRVLQPVGNLDTDIQTRFVSAVSTKTQMQGLLAVGGDRTVRFDQSYDGSTQRIFAASFVGTTPTARLNAAVPTTTPIDLRLTRVGDTWTARWSADGVSWNVAATFSFSMTLGSVGVFAGNAATPTPAFTSRVDYFRRVTADSTPPVISQIAVAPASDGATVTWTTDEPASSTVEFGPTTGYGSSAGDSSLAVTHQVQLVGLSCATQYHFRVRSADGGGNLATGSDAAFTTAGCPPPDTTAPVLSNIDAQATSNGAVVTWSTNEPSSSRVDYGTTTSYGQTAQGPNSVTSHTVTISGLVCATQYFYRVSSTDTAGNQGLGTPGSFTTPACQSSVLNDEFSGTSLNTSLWSLTDPVGDATVSVAQDRLRFSVPAGVSHDFWTPNRAPRLTQNVPDADIDVEAKFDSAVTVKNQSQGLVSEDPAGRLVRFDTYWDGTAQRLFGATFVNGTPTTRMSTVIPATAPIYLGLRRVNDTWTLRWSADNATWNVATTFTFVTDMSKIGVFVGNASPNPAMTALVDYFRVAGGGSPPPPSPLTISGVSATPGNTSADVSWTTNRPADTRLDYGTTTSYGQTMQDPADVTSHLVQATGLQCATTYHFKVSSTDPDGLAASSQDGTFTTTACPTQGGGVSSDDFSGPLDTDLWTVLNPGGDGQLAMTGTNAAMYVPSRTTHDMWTSAKTGLQLLQPAPDTDFEVETKFETKLELNRQTVGLLVKQDASNFLRFDESSNGTTVQLFAATVTGSTAVTRLNKTITAGDSVFLRIRREGNAWTLRHSVDGTSWTTDATFNYTMPVTQMGPYVGNGQGAAAVASVDYFNNLASPVVDDGGAPPATSQPGQIQPFYGDNQNVGVHGYPQQWAGVLGRATDADGIAQLWYRINNSAPRLLSVGPNNSRLEAAGDFVAEPDRAELVAGANSVVLTFIDRLGHQTTHTVTLNNVNGPAPALPYTVSWSGASAISDRGQVVDGVWQITGDTIRTAEPGYDRLVGVGSMDWPAGYEVTVPITVHSATSGGAGILVGWSGHSGTNQPRTLHPYGALGWFRLNRLELLDTNAVVVTSTSRFLTVDTTYNYKLRADPQGNGNSVYSFKVWQVGQPEPATWDLTTTLPSRAGSVLLLANDADASFGTVVVTPL